MYTRADRVRVAAYLTAGLAVVTLVTGCSSSGATKPGPTSTVASTNTTGTSKSSAVVVGSATSKVDIIVYEDYRCAPCKELHDELGPTLAQMAADGTANIEYHAVDQVDEVNGGHGSLFAANAADCANEADAFTDFREVLYSAQGAEGADDYASADIIFHLSHKVQGLDTPAFEKCVKSTPYAAAIKKDYATMTGVFTIQSAPAILIDGAEWPIPALGGTPGLVLAQFEASLPVATGN